MIRTSLLAAVALPLLTGTAWAEPWPGGDDLPTSPLACANGAVAMSHPAG